MSLTRQIRRAKRRLLIQGTIDWFLEEGRKYRIVTAVVITVGVLFSAGSHLILFASGISVHAQLGLGCLFDGVILLVTGLIVGVSQDTYE